MNNPQILFLLYNEKYLGLVPKAVIIDINNQGEMDVNYHFVTAKNKNNYTKLLNEKDQLLVNCCLQLEPDIIITKINDNSTKKWDNFAEKYIVKSGYYKSFEAFSKYIQDYILSYLNRFYNNIEDNPLYLKKGDLPSLWSKVYFEEGNPEVYYNFDYKNSIKYHLNIINDNKEILISGSQLLTSEPARILKGNTIIEFEKEINGNSLKPFFIKKAIEVEADKAEVYFQTFIKSLVNSRKRIIANGFIIDDLNVTLNQVLEIKLLSSSKQLSIFEEDSKTDANQKLVFSLFFEYGPFRFQCGHNLSTVKLEKTNEVYTFYRIERKKADEDSIVEEINKLGIQLKDHSQYLPFEQGIDWINNNYQTLLNLGIEIRQETMSLSEKKYFIGSSSINAEATESIDWFEVNGIVKFGSYSFRLQDIIKLIKQNKRELLLPNGEFARFPEAWIEEYYYLSKYCFFKEDKMFAAKHHLVILDEMNKKGGMQLALSSKLQAFLNSNFIDNYDLPKGFKGELRPYQREGYHWLRFLHDLNVGGCLADDMGLGKTIQTLCILQWIKEQKGGCSLLVVPKSLIYNWQQESNRFCPDLKILIYSGKKRFEMLDTFSDYDLMITSYPILRSDIDNIQTKMFNYCILDESQYIKNAGSDISKACMQINAAHYLTLTGTPIENSISDIWTQMHFLNRNILGSIHFFMKEFNSDEKIQRLQKILNPFILRRLKSKVAKDLPEKYISVQYCDMTPEQQERYKSVKNEYRNLILDKANKDKPDVKLCLLEGLLRMRQTANHPKLMDMNYTESSGKFEMATELLKTIISEGNKVLIFSSFVEHLKLYKNYLEHLNIPYCYLDGQTKNRKEEVSEFQNNPDKLVFLLSLKAGGVGLNLTAAEYVFLLDPWWNPASEAQAYDRTHRIGQKNNVFIYKFISRSSIEEKIMELQERKIKIADNLIQAEDGFIKSLNKADIDFLLN
ncbi:MAG: DEAD/DEAH box helicase [Bacteroidales bacterium]